MGLKISFISEEVQKDFVSKLQQQGFDSVVDPSDGTVLISGDDQCDQAWMVLSNYDSQLYSVVEVADTSVMAVASEARKREELSTNGVYVGDNADPVDRPISQPDHTNSSGGSLSMTSERFVGRKSEKFNRSKASDDVEAILVGYIKDKSDLKNAVGDVVDLLEYPEDYDESKKKEDDDDDNLDTQIEELEAQINELKKKKESDDSDSTDEKKKGRKSEEDEDPEDDDKSDETEDELNEEESELEDKLEEVEDDISDLEDKEVEEGLSDEEEDDLDNLRTERLALRESLVAIRKKKESLSTTNLKGSRKRQRRAKRRATGGRLA